MSKVYIRSQDRGELVLFGEGVGCLYYNLYTGSYPEKDEEIKERHAIVATGRNGKIYLGFYESKERCLEILDELEDICGQYLYASGSLGLIRGSMSVPPMAAEVPILYKMPET